jgi:putative transposase
MPAKHTVKEYKADSYYHIYHRGIEKRQIFVDESDYDTFLSFLKEALHPDEQQTSNDEKLKIKTPSSRKAKNFADHITLLSYVLMPNHFHLLIHQKDARAVNQFMQSLLVRYTMYFNKKHTHEGALFQGKYKAILVVEKPHLLHLTRFMHLKPKEFVENPARAYSSLAEYLGYREYPWINPQQILSFFTDDKREEIPELRFIFSYREFMEGDIKESSNILGQYTLEQ